MEVVEEEKTKNYPTHKFQEGNVSVARFENRRTVDNSEKLIPSLTVQISFKDKNGEFKNMKLNVSNEIQRLALIKGLTEITLSSPKDTWKYVPKEKTE